MTRSAVKPSTLPDRRTAAAGFSEQPWAARIALGVLGALTIALVGILWPHWRRNPELSHAFLTPLIFVLLLRESRSVSALRVPSGATLLLAQITALTAGLVVLAASGLYAAALDWSHSLVAFSLTVALALCWTAGVLAFHGRPGAPLRLNWPAIVAILLWLLSAPLPPGTYSRLTLGLQLAVSENVVRALHLLGIAASRHGNVIELATTSVGVEEACSGVRSLISCVFAGLLFSATLVRSPWARAGLIALSAPLAVAMNFVRSLLLTLLANAGVPIAGSWHDWTGFAVLGATALLLGGLALVLGRPARRRPQARAAIPDAAPPPVDGGASDAAPPAQPGTGASLWVLLSGLVAAVALAVFFVGNTRPSPRHNAPVPNLWAVLPETSHGWGVQTSDNLYQFSSTLQTNHLAQRTYLRPTESGMVQITIYLAYWRAGQAPASLVASHTPDACWPGSGWTARSNSAPRETLQVGGRRLPEAEARAFSKDDFPQYVWFWHLYDGHPIAYRDPYSARELLRSAWTYGFSHEGDQLFVRLSSNRPWPELAGEPLLTEVFGRLKPLGL